MLRILFLFIAAMAAPTVVYILWRTFAPRRAGGSEAIQAGQWERLPWLWLSVVGVVVLLITLGWLAVIDGGAPDARYQPPRTVDGRIEPGRMIPPERGR